MAVKKNGLGKGLDSLIVNKQGTAKKTDQKNEESGVLVNINKVEPNREQPRKNFDEDALMELSDSIKQFGVLSPLLVQDKGTYYEIIAGERRWRAAKMAGLKEVPVIIRNLTDQEKEEYMKNARLLVLPSKNESLSIVLLESMSYGRPVLVNGLCAVLKGQCIRSNAGLYYTNYEEFEAELEYMLNHPDICSEMGKNGYRFVKENYSWDLVINNIVSLMDEIHV